MTGGVCGGRVGGGVGGGWRGRQMGNVSIRGVWHDLIVITGYHDGKSTLSALQPGLNKHVTARRLSQVRFGF